IFHGRDPYRQGRYRQVHGQNLERWQIRSEAQQGVGKNPQKRSTSNERAQQMDRPPRQASRWKSKAVRPENVGDEGSDRTIGLRKTPWRGGKLGQFNLAASSPSVVRSRHDEHAVMEQDFRMDVLLIRLHDASEDEVHLSLAQLADLLRHGPYGCHIDCNTRVLPTEPAKRGRDQAGYDVLVAGDPNFTDRRIRQKLDALHALA